MLRRVPGRRPLRLLAGGVGREAHTHTAQDQANHRDVNHLAAGMKPGQINPFFDPEAKLDKMLLKYAHDILDKTPEEVKLRTMGPSGA